MILLFNLSFTLHVNRFKQKMPIRQIEIFKIMRQLYTYLFILILGVGSVGYDVYGQSVPVGTPFFEDALRRAQLMGRLNSDVSFTLRPIDGVRAMGMYSAHGLDTNYLPLDTNTYSTALDFRYNIHLDTLVMDPFLVVISRGKAIPGDPGNIRFSLLPVYLHTRQNTHHPYGWSDGPMVPARGFQQYMSFGAFAKIGFLEMQLRPEFVYAQNRPFQNPPIRYRRIDMPERMGQDPYSSSHWGQSYVKAHFGPMAVGISTENIWWGPGRRNAIIMSNNAPGFTHATIHTNKPINIGIGTIEGQLVGGRLRRSGFISPRRGQGGWPPIADNVFPDTINGTQAYGFFSGFTGVWQPKWLPGLFIGGTAVSQLASEDLPSYAQSMYEGFLRARRSDNIGQVGQSGLISLFTRYLFTESHAEVYAEIGRGDWWADFEDFWTMPMYHTTYMAGFRKIYALSGKDRWLELDAEVTKITAPMDNILRAAGSSMYGHGNGFGWTHRGQVLGAGIGPGSNMQTIGITHGKGFRTFGVHFERVSYNEDLFYTQMDFLNLGDGTNPFLVDFTKKFIDLGVILSYHNAFGKLNLGGKLHFLQTFNFQHVYAPDGVPDGFRFPGINVRSINLELSMVYRF